MQEEIQDSKTKEIWKDIPGYEGMYQVSNLGNVKSLDRIVKNIKNKKQRKLKGKLLSYGISGKNYYTVSLCKGGKCKTHFIHSLAAICFLNHDKNQKGMVVNHIDMNKLNNKLSNLEIISHRKNCYFKNENSTSKYVGVFWNSNKKTWNAQIYIGEKCFRLGSFKNEYDAHLAYQKKLNSLQE